MEISDKDLQNIHGEYVEMRHSSQVYYNVRTGPGDKIQKDYKEGFSVRVVDGKRLKTAHGVEPTFLSEIRSAKGVPVTVYTPPDPEQHYEDCPEPIELPVEEVKSILDQFTHTKSVQARLESLTAYEHIVTNRGTDVYCGNSKLLIRVFVTPVQGMTLTYSFGYPGVNVIKEMEHMEGPDMSKFSHLKSIPSGKYDVVLSPQATGVIFHELAHLFEGSLPKMEVPSFISVSDNPEAEGLGGYLYDSEGCKASHTLLIEKGTPKRCLASIFEPGTILPTGNGRASAFDVEPIPRQTNLRVDSHTQCTEEELLEMVGNGVYIAQVGEGTAFPGGITYFYNTVAHHIEKGKCKEALKNVGFGGNLREMVNSIEHMGGTSTMEPIVCWKNKQRLFVSVQAPSSLVRGVRLSCQTSSKS